MTDHQKSMAKRFWLLFKSDAQNLSRDPILLFVTFFGVITAPLFLTYRTQIDNFGMDMFNWTNLSGITAPLALLVPAFLIGWVAGFLMLEDRDDHTLLAIETTPVGKNGFITYRLTMAGAIVALLSTSSGVQIYPTLNVAIILLLALLVAMEAAIVALLLLALASNKVEGLALSKLLNLGLLFPLLAVIPSTWRLLFGIMPSFWIGEVLTRSTIGDTNIFTTLILAALAHVIWLAYLLKTTAQRTEKL